jgi:hypothetical protein
MLLFVVDILLDTFVQLPHHRLDITIFSKFFEFFVDESHLLLDNFLEFMSRVQHISSIHLQSIVIFARKLSQNFLVLLDHSLMNSFRFFDLLLQ